MIDKQRRLKICDLLQMYTAKSGGIRTYIHAKRTYIQQNTSHEHILIVPGETDAVQKNNQCTVYQISAPLIPKCHPYRFIIRLDKVLSILLKEQPDIIELGNAYVLPWVAFLYRKIYKCTIVGYYHADFPKTYIHDTISKLTNEWLGKQAELLARRYARAVYKRCDSTIVASQNLTNTLKSYNIPHIKYIPLGVDAQLFHPAKRNMELRQHLLGSQKGNILLYVGRLDTEKRVEILVESFRKLPKSQHIVMIIVGDGPLKSHLEEISKKESGLFILPYMHDKRTLAQLYASADVYVTAGPYETFGLCVVEAQASGLPVVGVNAGALIERVPDQLGLLGAVDSPEAMSRNIMHIINNDYKEKGNAARKWIEDNYSWDSVFEQLFNLYNQKNEKT